MNIWFFNQYASEPSLGVPGRHFFLARELSQLGNKLTIITSSHTHLRLKTKKINGFWSKTNSNGVNYLWFQVLKYNSSTSLIRVLNWFIYSLSILLTPLIIRAKPDVIVYSSPSPFGFITCYLLSKLFNCKLIFEVRDIWPKSLVELGGINASNPVIKLMSMIEKFAYRSSDRVWSNLQYSYLHMIKNGLNGKENFSWFPNGVTVDFDEVSFADYEITESYLQLKELKEKKKIVGYIGTIGNANALNNLLESAIILNNKNVAFVIIGNGNEKKKLIEFVNKNELKNIYFFEAVPFKLVNKHIELFDICFLGTKNIELYKYGIASLKLPEYMLCKKPVIHAALISVVEVANCGIRVKPDSPYDLALGIEKLLLKTSEELNILGLNGMLYASNVFNYKNIARSMEEELIELKAAS